MSRDIRALRFPALALLVVAVLLAPEADPWFRLALALAGCAAALSLAHPLASPPGRSGLIVAALAGLPLAISLWGNVDAAAARDRLVTLALMVIAFRAGRDLPGPGRRRVLAGCLAGLGTLTSLHALWQRAVGFRLALEALPALGLENADAYAARLASGRVFSTFLLPSTFAGFLLLSLPSTIWLAGRLAARRTRVALATAAVLQAVALLLTYSHGAMLALAAALVVLGMTAPSRSARRLASAAAALAGIALLVIAALRGESLAGMHGPVAERLGNWQVAIGEIADHPIAGVGPGCFGAAYTRYQEAGMNQSWYAHNTFLQIVAEGGLMTLPFVLLFLGRVLGPRRRRLPGSGALDLALVATALHNLVDFTLLQASVAVPFFLVLGAVSPRPRWETTDPRVGRIAALALAAFLPVAAIPAAIGADHAAAARTALLEGRGAAAGERMRSAIRWDPWAAEYFDFLARWGVEHALDASGLARARRDAERAIELAPLTPHHQGALEIVCLAQGDLACAWRAASRAAALFPASPAYAGRRDAILSRIEERR